MKNKSKNCLLTQILTICMFALCSFETKAELEKYYELADDNFEYFRVTDYRFNSTGDMISSKCGAMDVNGNILVPIEFDLVGYRPQDDREGYFYVKSEQPDGTIYEGVYSKDGKCLIPIYRQFTSIRKDKTQGKEYFLYKRGNREVGICDATGKIIANLKVHKDAKYIVLMQNLEMYFVEFEDDTTLFYDYSLTCLGDNANDAGPIARQRKLKAPLADSPAHSSETLINTTSASSASHQATKKSDIEYSFSNSDVEYGRLNSKGEIINSNLTEIQADGMIYFKIEFAGNAANILFYEKDTNSNQVLKTIITDKISPIRSNFFIKDDNITLYATNHIIIIYRNGDIGISDSVNRLYPKPNGKVWLCMGSGIPMVEYANGKTFEGLSTKLNQFK